MNIPSLQFFNINRTNFNTPSNKRIHFTANKDSWQGAGAIDKDNRERLSCIVYAYQELYQILNKKTAQGKENIEQDFGSLTINNGITFRNINNANETIQITIPTHKNLDNLTKFIVYDKNKNIKDGYLIYGNSYIVKNYNPQVPDEIPAKYEFYSSQELKQQNLDEKITQILDDVDPLILRLRKIVNNSSNTDIKEEVLSGQYSDALNNMQEIDDKLSTYFKTIPHTKVTRLRSSYTSYVPNNTAHSYTFKNLGSDKLTLTYANVNSSQYGKVSRILVYDKEGNTQDGFLIKDNLIVKNYNPQYPAVFPPKPIFVDKNEFSQKRFSIDFSNYLYLLNKEMTNFYTEITKVPDVKQDGIFSDTDKQNLSEIKGLYSSITKNLDSFYPKEIFDIKNAYPNLEQIAGKRGFTFTDLKDGNKSVTIYRMAVKKHDDLLKLSITDEKNQEKVFLICGNKLVKNYNPAYTAIPEILTFYNEDDMPDISEYLNIAKEQLCNFNSHVEKSANELNIKKAEYKRQKEESRAQKELRRQQKQESTQTKALRGRPKTEKTPEQLAQIQARHYTAFVNQCTKEFKQILLNAPNNIDEFNQSLQELQAKINTTLIKSE